MSEAVPPMDLDAEEAVLGAMLLSAKAVETVAGILVPTDFYRGSHRVIYRAALALRDRGEPVDCITLTADLERRGDLEEAGGRTRLLELGKIVPAAGNVAHYAITV